MKTIIVVACLLALSGCAAIATKDIDQAIGLATRAGDEQGLACLNAQKLIFSVEPIGIFTVIEQSRLMQIALDICTNVIPAGVLK